MTPLTLALYIVAVALAIIPAAVCLAVAAIVASSLWRMFDNWVNRGR